MAVSTWTEKTQIHVSRDILISSPTYNVLRDELEMVAFQRGESLLDDVVQMHQDALTTVRDIESSCPLLNTSQDPDADQGIRTATSRIVMRLFPVYFSAEAQHIVLEQTATLLQHVCFDFAQRRLPQVLETRGWSSPESADLALWAAELLLHRDKLISSALSTARLHRLLWGLAAISCIVIYSIPICVNLIQELLRLAKELAELLGDALLNVMTIEKLQHDCNMVAQQLDIQKSSLYAKAEAALHKIDTSSLRPSERAARAAQVIHEMREDDCKCVAQVGRLLRQEVGRYTRPIPTTILTDVMDSISEKQPSA